jgi:WD40 repeat protein
MDAEKLARLEERLYSDAPLLGEVIRQQAAKELADTKTPESIKLLAKALIFSKDRKVQNLVLNSLRQIKLQDQASIDAICEIWAENRDLELAKFIKLKGWVASKPIKLRLLAALKIGWQGVIEEKGTSIVMPLLALLEDEDVEIAERAKEWALSLANSELQQEVCRLAVEENHHLALEIAKEAVYVPKASEKAALFYFLTEQWEKYQNIDPQQKLLASIYYSASPELQQRIDEKGETGNRIEWVWMVVGGTEGQRLAQISDLIWPKILHILARGKYWQEMWSLVSLAPAIWAKPILNKLEKSKWLPKSPQQRTVLTNLLPLANQCQTKEPPQGTLVRCLKTLTGHTQGIESMIISPDGQLLLSAGDEIIRVWQLANGELLTTLPGHLHSVTSLGLSKDGRLLASGSRDRTICLWRLPEGNLLHNLSAHVASVWCLGMTGDGKILASGSYQEARLWQYPPGRLLNNLKEHKREVDCLTISPDENLLITGGGYLDGTVCLWQLPKGKHFKTLEGHSEGISCLAISPDNNLLATGSKDCTVRLWTLPEGHLSATLEGHTGRIWCLKISPDGSLLATGSDDQTVKLWQLPEGKLLATLEGHTEAVWCLAVSTDGQLLASGSKDKTLKLWRLPEGQAVATLRGHEQPVRCVGITPDGQMLVSGSKDKTLRLWRWDLPRLASLPLNSLSDGDRQWIQEALENQQITEPERHWLTFLHQLTQLTRRHGEEETGKN